LSDAVATASGKLSPFEQGLAWLGIRPEERSVTAMLFTNMFMSGISIGMIRVCAFTLFLENFGSERLALVAILLAITGTVVTLVIERFTQRFSVGVRLYTILGTVIFGLIAFRILLGISDNKAIIFGLPLFFEITYMLFSLQYLALLSRLMNVRQTKRLSGLARSGEFLAEMVGGLSIALLLRFVDVVDLLAVAIVATLLVVVIVRRTIKRFSGRLVLTNEDLSESDQGHLLGLLRLRYVRLIGLCYGAYIFAYFFLDVAFYDYASQKYPNQIQLAEFLGQFFAMTGFATLFAMVFLFAPFLRRFGILAAVLAFPIVIATGSIAVSLLEITDASVAIIFIVMVATNGCRFVLQSAIWRPTWAILFQVLSDRQRMQGTSLIEGVVDPFFGGVAGVCLYFLSDYLQWEPQRFLLILAAIMVLWIALGMIIHRMYLANLVVSLQKRKLGELSLKELDGASLDIIKQGLKSSYPSEIFYCLNILEEIEHPEITELIKQVISNHNHDIRMDVLNRIARMAITPLTEQVNQRIRIESDPRVRGQALKTYAALAASDTVDVLTPYLSAFHSDIRRGALVGLLSFDPDNVAGLSYLQEVVRSPVKEDRLFAASAMGEIGSKAYSHFLEELLDDADVDVVNGAITAAGHMRDSRLNTVLVGKISDPVLQGRASHALKQIGEQALHDLDVGFTNPDATRQLRRHIIDIVREIGGQNAIEMLLRHIDIPQAELRHQVYLGLATLHYQADRDDQYVFVNKLEDEVQHITWLLASMADLYRDERYHQLTAALGQELDQHRDSMLLLISFIFPSIVMLDTRANIDSKISELRVFALEVLDNLLTAEIKQVVIPILDDISVAERLTLLSDRYPQEKMDPDNRFHSLVADHFDECVFWSRASLLYLIGGMGFKAHLAVVENCLKDPEPIIRETASWTLAQLEPADLKRVLTAQADDPDRAVSRVVRELLADL
jgi:ATP:ADP antiporter, AAA family